MKFMILNDWIVSISYHILSVMDVQMLGQTNEFVYPCHRGVPLINY